MKNSKRIRYCIIAAGVLISAAFYVSGGAAEASGNSETVFIGEEAAHTGGDGNSISGSWLAAAHVNEATDKNEAAMDEDKDSSSGEEQRAGSMYLTSAESSASLQAAADSMSLSEEELGKLKEAVREAVREELVAICEEGYLEAALSEAADEAAREAELRKEMVNINTAGIEELMTLPGIGEKRAGDIVAYRQEHGAFNTPSDIMQVDGIKEAAYTKIKDKIYT